MHEHTITKREAELMNNTHELHTIHHIAPP